MANSTLHRVNKTILVAPYDGPLAAALVSEARAAGWTVAIASAGAKQGVASEPSAVGADPAAAALPSGVSVFPLTPGSYVSSTTLFLSVRNALGEPDVVAIVSDAAQDRAGGEDLVGGRPGEIESAIQRATLGPAMLAREALRCFGARKAGRLVLLGEEPEGETLGPAAALAAGAFRGLGEGVFVAAREAPWEAFGILDKSGTPGEAARFVMRLLDEGRGGKSGRWLRFSGKPGLFGVF